MDTKQLIENLVEYAREVILSGETSRNLCEKGLDLLTMIGKLPEENTLAGAIMYEGLIPLEGAPGRGVVAYLSPEAYRNIRKILIDDNKKIAAIKQIRAEAVDKDGKPMNRPGFCDLGLKDAKDAAENIDNWTRIFSWSFFRLN